MGGSDHGDVFIGTYGVGSSQGSVALEAGLNLDMISGISSTVDIRSGGGLDADVIKVGKSGTGNFNITASDVWAVLYLNQAGSGPFGTYSIANDFIITSGTGVGSSATAHVLIRNPDVFTIGTGIAGGDLIVQARDSENGFALIDVNSDNPIDYFIGGNFQVLGGTASYASAEANLRTKGGGSHTITEGILIQSGTQAGTTATLAVGNSVVSVQNDVQITAQNAPTNYVFGDIDNTLCQLLVSGGISVIAGSSAGGTGASASISGEGSFYSEVVNNVLVQGGSDTDASALISALTISSPAEQTLYVGGTVSCIGGSANNTSATIEVASFGPTVVQSLEAGQDITFTGGSGMGALAGIRNAGLYDPTGILFGFPVITAGPTLNIQSLGNITCQNGTGSQAYALLGTDNTLIPPGYPLAQYVSGSVIAQAGGNINISAPLNKNYNAGALNENHQIVLYANRQFAPGSLWPSNTLLGISGPSLYPTGFGGITFDTGSFNTNTLLGTNKGNISLVSAALDSAGTNPIDFIDGILPNEALLSTNNGNIFILGFRDISIDASLTTQGNNTLVPTAVYNIEMQANNAVTVNDPISLPTANYSIGIKSSSITNDPITLNASITANSTSGLIAVLDNSGPITQTAGTLTAYTVNLSAGQGISGPAPIINALNTSAHIINATNASSGNIALLNILGGTSATYASATLTNGAGGTFNNRSITFIQAGGTSLSLENAVCDGDILVGAFSGIGNLSINGNVRPGRHVMGVGYGDLVLTAGGRVQGVENVTLICDEAYPNNTGPGWFSNLSTVGGVTTESADQNIAVYAASGPLSSTLNPPNQVILGNLSSDATWDAGLPGGLDSKYATSYQNGGPYHGPGFGMNYTPGNGVFGSSVIWYKYPMPPYPPIIPPYHDIGQAAFAIQGLTLQIWEMRLIDYVGFNLLWQSDSDCFYPLFRYRLPIPFKTDPPRLNDSYERTIYASHFNDI